MHVRDVIADFIAEILTLRVVSSTGMWITFIQKQWPACNKHSGSWQSHKHHFNLDQHYYFHIHLPPFLLCGLSKLLHSELHWLDISQRVQYKLGVIVHQCLQNNAPQYLVDYCKRTSNVSSRQRLRSANRYQLIVARHQTLINAWWPWIPSGFGTCAEHPAVVCQECTVADDVPSRDEDCTFPVVIVLHSITAVCPRLLTVGDSVVFVCFSFWFCTVPLQCKWRDSVTLISTLLFTYLLISQMMQDRTIVTMEGQ